MTLGILSGLLIVFTLIKIAFSGESDMIPEKRVALGYGGLIASTVLGLGVIYGYYLVSDSGFVWFGVTTLLAYLAGLLLFAFQNIRKNTRTK